MIDFDYQKFKNELRVNKITIQDFANTVDTSLASANRWLNNGKIPFERLKKACDYYGFKLNDYIKEELMVEEPKEKYHTTPDTSKEVLYQSVMKLQLKVDDLERRVLALENK